MRGPPESFAAMFAVLGSRVWPTVCVASWPHQVDLVHAAAGERLPMDRLKRVCSLSVRRQVHPGTTAWFLGLVLAAALVSTGSASQARHSSIVTQKACRQSV